MGKPGKGKGKWSSAALTDAGPRRGHNEDAVLACDTAAIWCVADGMGGHEAGDLASRHLVEHLRQLNLLDDLGEAIDQVDDGLEEANQWLRDYADRELGGRTLGTTVVVMLARGELGACLWAGDSRLFRWREGRLQQLSTDHSEVQQLVEQGVLSAAEADAHPNANVITRAVGAAPRILADVMLFSVEPGDRFLLCSDGLYNEVSTEEMSRRLEATVAPDACARELLDAALARDARDNVSVVVIRPEAA